jgi:CelD/BcsL family acetyltransferase involved in cellulose biosynthesis
MRSPTLESPISPESNFPSMKNEAYQLELIETPQAFEALESEWDQFLQSAGTANLAMTHAFLSHWIRRFQPKQLKIVIVKNQDQWIAVAPFQINPGQTGYSQRLLKHLQWIGTNPTIADWVSIPMMANADRKAIIKLLAQEMKRWKWDLVDLHFNPKQEELLELCQHLNPNVNTADAIRDTMPIPWLDLPMPEEEFLKTRRSKTRLDLNRFNNRIKANTGEAAVLTYHTAAPSKWEKTRDLFNHFAAGHASYWAEKGVKSDFVRYPGLKDFYLDMLQEAQKVSSDKPFLEFNSLDLQGKPMCYQISCWQGNHYLSHMTHYEDGYKEYSPGILHMENLVLQTFKRGGTHFDFGRGEQQYKKLWTKTNRPLWNLRLFRNSLSKAIWDIDATLKRWAGKDSI